MTKTAAEGQAKEKQKEKQILKSGVKRKKGHISARTRRDQTKRDIKEAALQGALNKIDEKANKRTSASTAKKTTSSKARNVKFVGLPNSKALDKYVRSHCNGLLKRIAAHPQKYQIKFSIKPEAKNQEAQVSSFKVDGSVTIVGRKSLRASAKGPDVKKMVDQVIEALETKIRRETEKRERSRKTVGQSLQPVKEYLWEMSHNAE